MASRHGICEESKSIREGGGERGEVSRERGEVGKGDGGMIGGNVEQLGRERHAARDRMRMDRARERERGR